MTKPRPYAVEDGNNVPVHAPLIPTPFVPYQCANNRTLTVYAKADPAVIQKYLENTPFEYVDDIIMLYVQDFTNTDRFSFWDCGLVVSARYKDVRGGYFLFEYENEDYAIAAGRELWGYPKKYAEINLIEKSDRIVASAVKENREIIRLELDKTTPCAAQKPDASFLPHLLLPTVPNGDKPGIFSQRVMARDTSPDFKMRSQITCNAAMNLRPVRNDALDEFASAEILCGTFTLGEYFATEEHGWAKVLDTII